jgi:hypothetical protein
MGEPQELLGPIEGARHEVFAGIGVDVVEAGSARVKRLVYPVGLRWSVDVQPLVGTEQCLHAHFGFLAQGELHGSYADGCAFAFRAPAVVTIEAGHDAWVVGDEDAVLIQVDFGPDTVTRLGLPSQHPHG